MIKYIKEYIFKYKIIYLYIVLSIILYILKIITPYLNGTLIDNLIYSKNIDIVLSYSLIIIIINLISIFISYLNSVTTSKLQMNITFDLNKKLILHMQKLPYLEVINYNSTYITQRMNNDSNILSLFFLNNIIAFFINIINIIFSLIILSKINMSLLIVITFFIPIYILTYLILRNPLYHSSIEFKENQSNYFQDLNNQISFIKSIKTNSLYENSELELECSYKNLFTSAMKNIKLSTVFSSLDNVISIIFQSITLILGIILIINEKITIGKFTIISTYFSILLGSIKYYLNFGKEFTNAKSSFNRINEINNFKEETEGNIIISHIDNIQVKNLSFCYSNLKEKFLISDLSFKLEKSNIYILVGKNGCGKSTLINIITGIIKSNSNLKGQILYNNIDINKINSYELRKYKISIVQQEPTFNNDLCINIIKSITIQYYNEEKIYNKLKQLGLYNFFQSKKFSNLLYKNFKNLSGGEKQKMAILIAVLKDFDFLILDEPSSSLDSYTKRELIDIIKILSINKIILIINHDKEIMEITKNIIAL